MLRDAFSPKHLSIETLDTIGRGKHAPSGRHGPFHSKIATWVNYDAKKQSSQPKICFVEIIPCSAGGVETIKTKHHTAYTQNRYYPVIIALMSH